MTDILVRGAGIAGLTTAFAFARRGASVRLCETREGLPGRGSANASWYAGGMLAPNCERESAEESIQRRGLEAIEWWDQALPGQVVRAGTLVVAPARDRADLARFADRTESHSHLDGDEVAALEPDLAGTFGQGLFFPGEAHLDPRLTMIALLGRLMDLGVDVQFGPEQNPHGKCEFEIDCTGMLAARLEPDESAGIGLRGVRGEMLILRTSDVNLTRTVRLLHPRIPLYIVPRADHHFMIGATMIESDAETGITARSMMELLNAAYSINPAFGEAEIVETGSGVRPAYADNLPRLTKTRRGLAINGLYRHGFLLAPALAEAAVGIVCDNKTDPEFFHEADHQRRTD